MFRGKESSNRIELSRLVQDLLNFAVLGSLQLWGGGRWVEGCLGTSRGMGGVPTCTHTHAHTHICIEIANGRRHGGIHVWHVYHVQHACACMYMCVCMGHPPHPYPPPPPSTHPPAPSGGGPPESVKF